MRFLGVGDRYFDEIERQEREDRRLDEPDEDLKEHEGYRKNKRYKEGNNKNEHLPCEDVPKEAERKRDEARNLAKELDDPYHERQRRFQVNKLARILRSE